MSDDFLGKRRHALEESFFAAKNRQLLDNLRSQAEADAAKEELRKASGIEDDQIIELLQSQEIGAETLVALSLVPLIEVAWADGKIDERERSAVMEAATSHGVTSGSASHQMLTAWLEDRPGEEILNTWREYVETATSAMDAPSRNAFKNALLNRAREVAEAAGGILGFGNKISDSEQAVLQKLGDCFG